ncbi:MAG: VWA domain-containing protein [Isosphaeraceae bacterium]|nr:VWA domain-containing protein [Isosphaeraceae bacterium]
MGSLELTRPLWLIGLVTLPFIIYYFYRSLVDFPFRQRVLSLACRAAIVVLLVLALAGLTLLSPTRRQFVVFVVDKSLSIGDDARQKADEFIKRAAERKGNNGIGYLAFAAEPGVFHPEKMTGTPPADDKGTDLAAAIEVAAAATPPFYVPQIVLLTDGNQTAGDALKAALRTGVPVSTVPLSPRNDPEVQVSGVLAPAQVQQGEPFYVEVVLDSNHDDEGEIEVYRGPHKVISERRELKKGENRFRFRQTIEQGQERLAQFTARARGFQDTLLDNNSDFGLVSTSGKPRLLMIEDDPKTAKDLAWALEEQEMQVDVRPPQGMPSDLADLQNYELLILSNVPATKLSLKQMEVARSYVQDLGGGLIMLGGDQSFGLGGYYKTVLEEILPVRSDFEKEKEKPSLAMVLVIDKSGSMGGEKIELAKEAAKSAIELLGPNDKVGIIAFEGDVFWVSDVHPCSDKGYVLDRVASIEAGGGTNMYPAMEEAFEALTKTQAKLKHVIILTDGISAPGDFEGCAASMRSAQITCSMVGVGEGCDQALLEEIAKIGGGRYYFTDDPLSIPQIFAKETVAASKSAINEQPFLPQVYRPTQALNDIDFDGAPPLLGYVVTRPKPTSEVILLAETGDPLLAWWRYGLGMSVAFTSDAKPRWAAEWLSWPSYGRFWAQVIRHVMRKSDAKGVVMQVERKGRKAIVALDAIAPSGKFLNNAQTELTIIDPSLGNKKIAMTQTAPGRYVAEFETPMAGSYHLDFSQKYEGKLLYHQSRGLAIGYPDELRLQPTNTDLLQSIAQASGGRYDPSPDQVFDDPLNRTARRALPLWPYLVMAAAALFVADVALRRIDFSLALWPRFSRRISLSILRNPS